ncbi:FMN-dependent dehydrogenase-domain-containing protein [Peziza echinospora]|nr:FMN-dependent dehydrogenase-domain-containing protein [Peziza echinospora]
MDPPVIPQPEKKFDVAEVAKHNTPESCWVILYGKVYDVTDFLPSHPGGSKAILTLAGTDATADYDPIHPPGLLEQTLTSKHLLGEINVTTIPHQLPVPPPPNTPTTGLTPIAVPVLTENPILGHTHDLPPLTSQLNLEDFTLTAQKILTPKAWAYYFSAADDLHTKTLNNTAYTSLLLRPRIFRNVEHVDTTLTLLGEAKQPSALPLFISPAAMARLAHPSGESGIAHACGKAGIVQIVSNNASQTFEAIAAAKIAPTQPQWFQLYVQTTLAKSEAVLKRVNELGYTAIVLTLDAPTPGKREADERVKNLQGTTSAVHAASSSSSSSTSPSPSETPSPAPASAPAPTGEGLGRALFAGTSPTLTWADLTWLRQHTPLPIILKGIQTHDDALLASQNPLVSGIILSNHGGRALDTAPPAIYTLLEIRKYCPEVLQKIEVYVDGGIKRGTDVIKALCLGAKAVGIGRAALFGLAGYGEAGVGRVIEILREEIETCMRLLGVNSLNELGPQYVNTSALDLLIYKDPNFPYPPPPPPPAIEEPSPLPPPLVPDVEEFPPLKAKL